MTHILKLSLGVALLVAACTTRESQADEKQAATCIRTQTWDNYIEGWSVRVMKTFGLPEYDKDYKTFKVSMLPGNEYLVYTCADEGVGRLAVALYDFDDPKTDATGRPIPVVVNITSGREPRFSYKPTKAGTYVVAVKALDYAGDPPKSGVSAAVAYR